MTGVAHFDNKLRPAESGCIEWAGLITSHGYGRFKFRGRMVFAHRFAYESMVGPIQDGLVLDHTCGNRRCVNPEHLEPVTIGENTRRSPLFGGKKTHCKHGHEFTPENTLVTTQNNGRYAKRVCLTCRRNWDRADYAEHLESRRRAARQRRKAWYWASEENRTADRAARAERRKRERALRIPLEEA